MAHLPPTSHPAMRAHILHSLLTRMALSLDQSPTPAATSAPATPLPFLLLGTTSTRIASLTIASLAVGRGYALPLLVTPFLEYRGVRMLRPLTASGKKELVWYARWRGLAAVDWDWESGARNSDSGRATSIEALTQGTPFTRMPLPIIYRCSRPSKSLRRLCADAQQHPPVDC